MMKKSKRESCWVEPVQLSNKDRKDLSMIINVPTDDEIFSKIEDALTLSATNQQTYERMERDGNQKELKLALMSIIKAQERTIRKLDQFSVIEGELLDQSCWVANGYDADFLRGTPFQGGSVVRAQAMKIKRGAEFHLKFMGMPSKKSHKHSRALADFAAMFQDIYPSKKLSAQPMSLFYRLVQFWFNRCVNVSIEDVGRKIEKLKEFIGAE